MKSNSPKGTLYIVSAPSGTGKTTLMKALLERVPGILVSVSHTTRKQRPAEVDGINYFFVDQGKFETMIEQDAFLEYANVFGNLYGTTRAWVLEMLEKGLDIILEIDWQGAQKVRKIFPDSLSIFILPPSIEELRQRLTVRNQDSMVTIDQRMAGVHQEVARISEYDYLLVNDDFNGTLDNLISIVKSQRLRRDKQEKRCAEIVSALSLENY